MMNLVARVIATHELVLLSFYPFVQKYMQPHQLKVTNILAYAAMATHALVPPGVCVCVCVCARALV
jgi:protein SDA1